MNELDVAYIARPVDGEPVSVGDVVTLIERLVGEWGAAWIVDRADRHGDGYPVAIVPEDSLSLLAV